MGPSPSLPLHTSMSPLLRMMKGGGRNCITMIAFFWSKWCTCRFRTGGWRWVQRAGRHVWLLAGRQAYVAAGRQADDEYSPPKINLAKRGQ